MSEPASLSNPAIPPRSVYDSKIRSTRTNCPVILPFADALNSAKAFTKAIRCLRRSLLKCDQCSGVDDCPIRKQIGQAIDIAILEVTDEWGLAHD